MKTKEIVRELLKTKPSLKDDDNRLTTHIWFRELQELGIDPHNTPITEFLKKYADNKITVAPTLTRIRRKLQEEEPEFRGEKYYLRKGTYQNEWRKKLGYEENNK